jgi:hypothetical protein
LGLEPSPPLQPYTIIYASSQTTYMKLDDKTFKECLTHHDLASDKALFN